MTQNEKDYLVLRARHHYEKYTMFKSELEEHLSIPHSKANFNSPMLEKEYWKEYHRLYTRVNYHYARTHALCRAARED